MSSERSEKSHESRGMIIRGADGSLYFIRNELLEACQLPHDLAAQAEELMSRKEEHEDFRVKFGSEFQPIAHVSGPIGVLGAGYRINVKAAGTIMCPSFLFGRVGEQQEEPG